MQEKEASKAGGPALHISELVDLAYGVAREQFGDKLFSFSSIWSKVWKMADRFSREKVENWIGYFYSELSTDPRFIMYSFNNWKLKEFVPLKEVQKFEKVIFSSESLFEEEYEAYVDSSKGKNKEVEVIAMDGDENDMGGPDEEEGEENDNPEEREEIFESEEE